MGVMKNQTTTVKVGQRPLAGAMAPPMRPDFRWRR